MKLKNLVLKNLTSDVDYNNDADGFHAVIERVYMQSDREAKIAIDDIFELLTGATLGEMLSETGGEEVTDEVPEISNGFIP